MAIETVPRPRIFLQDSSYRDTGIWYNVTMLNESCYYLQDPRVEHSSPFSYDRKVNSRSVFETEFSAVDSGYRAEMWIISKDVKSNYKPERFGKQEGDYYLPAVNILGHTCLPSIGRHIDKFSVVTVYFKENQEENQKEEKVMGNEKEVTMNEYVLDTYEKTEDAVLVNKWFGKDINTEFDFMVLKDLCHEILARAMELEAKQLKARAV